MTGQQVSHYEILDRLGEGSMGVVYRARDTRLNRSLALKFLSAKTSDDAEPRRRFFRKPRRPRR